MAEVFLATDRHGAPVVLKRPLPELAEDAGYRESLEHEAAITARLEHPHLVRTLGLDDEDGQRALVLEYVDGTTLARILSGLQAEGRRLSTGTAIRVVVDVLDALAHAHAATDASGRPLGLVHRDVNPCNVLVARDGTVKLTDFGIARSRAARARTRTGTVKGTLRYLSPEQATGSDVDARTDVHAAGLLLFEMLAGEPYLLGESDLELLRAAEDPPRRELPEGVAIENAVERALASALARFPEERPSSAAAFRQKLLPFAGEEATARAELATCVPADERAPSPAVPSRSSPRTRRAALGLLALVASAVAGVATLRTTTRAPLPTEHRAVQPAPRIAQANAATSDGSEHGSQAPTLATAPEAAPRAAVRPTRSEGPARGARTPTPAGGGSGDRVTPVDAPQADAPVAAAGTSSMPSRESVRGKLARADAAIRAARARGMDVRIPTDLSATALEAYAEGRYGDADRLLDRILGAVTAPESGAE